MTTWIQRPAWVKSEGYGWWRRIVLLLAVLFFLWAIGFVFFGSGGGGGGAYEIGPNGKKINIQTQNH